MKFEFYVWPPRPTERPGHYTVKTIERYARTAGDAYAMGVAEELEPGERVLSFTPFRNESCTMCGGPFHPATGHWESSKRHWCGPCTRGMVQLLKETMGRRVGHSKARGGSVRFYDYAFVPPGTPPPALLDDD